ncbi:MAG TPA: hypothetical protein VN428_15775 [Bryobacteraceae bacterium]|nr:hypothetical protein [Bryobacteraceae bacterium]
MPAYSGKFEYSAETGAPLGAGPCQLSFDAEECRVTPVSGAAIAFDLGDVNAVVPGDWELQLALHTGRQLFLRQFGPAFGRMMAELTAAWRDRMVQCLLLEDLEELDRFNGTVATAAGFPAPAEIRIFKSNIAVLRERGMPFQRRLADVDAVDFDAASYSVTLASGSECAIVSKLAKRTDAFRATLKKAHENLREHSVRALRKLFPFLDTDRLLRLQAMMPEGRSVRLSALAAIHPEIPEAFAARAAGPTLKPYLDVLRMGMVPDSLMAGFKFVRKETVEGTSPEEETAAAPAPEDATEDAAPAAEIEEDDGGESVFCWFFIPMALAADSKRHANIIAWEAGTGTGRATYFFRIAPPEQAGTLQEPTRARAVVDASVADLTRGLALVNFRREPVYLPDASLQQQPRYRRYAIGCRRLPALRALRAAYLGRAIHSSMETWSAQVQAILAVVR